MPKAAMINNWIDEKEVYPLNSDDPGIFDFKRACDLENKFIIMYSGNIGLYYDLENLAKVIEHFKDAKTSDGRNVVFAFVGAGTVKDKLVEYKEAHAMHNVVFIPCQDKDKLIYGLNSADVHWCVNARGIKGVSCPSKFYGIAAAAKPVLSVPESGSEIRLLVDETRCGLSAEPGDYVQI